MFEHITQNTGLKNKKKLSCKEAHYNSICLEAPSQDLVKINMIQLINDISNSILFYTTCPFIQIPLSLLYQNMSLYANTSTNCCIKIIPLYKYPLYLCCIQIVLYTYTSKRVIISRKQKSENTMANRKRTKRQTIAHNTLHRKLKIEQHEPY